MDMQLEMHSAEPRLQSHDIKPVKEVKGKSQMASSVRGAGSRGWLREETLF